MHCVCCGKKLSVESYKNLTAAPVSSAATSEELEVKKYLVEARRSLEGVSQQLSFVARQYPTHIELLKSVNINLVKLIARLEELIARLVGLQQKKSASNDKFFYLVLQQLRESAKAISYVVHKFTGGREFREELVGISEKLQRIIQRWKQEFGSVIGEAGLNDQMSRYDKEDFTLKIPLSRMDESIPGFTPLAVDPNQDDLFEKARDNSPHLQDVTPFTRG